MVGGRASIVEQDTTLAIVKGNWQYIQPSNGEAIIATTNVETGNSKLPQLYDLSKDVGGGKQRS